MRRWLPPLLCSLLALGAGQSALAQPKKPAAVARPKIGRPVGRPPKGPPPKPGQPSDAARRAVAGGPVPSGDDTSETPEQRAVREAERELFPRPAPATRSPLLDGGKLAPAPVEVSASGLAPQPAAGPAADSPDAQRPAWMASLRMPDLGGRWDERVVRYLQFFRDDPRGKAMAAIGWKRAGRYRDVIKAALRQEHLPESLLWVAMVESGFETRIRSHAGAAGLWQMMPDTGRLYGLRVDRGGDERADALKSSLAAARYLGDLQRRFGGWELALAAYNMGHGGVMNAIRKYNTNDFWELCRLEAGIPWETTLYVPKIIALAVVAENPSVFGLDGLVVEPAVLPDPAAKRASAAPDDTVDPDDTDEPHPPAAVAVAPDADRPVVVVPRSPAAIPGRQRVFYRVVPGDTLASVASTLAVPADDLRSWNRLDPSARLPEGMTLQVFVEPTRDLSKTLVRRESDVRVLTVGSDEFFAWFEAQKGRRRLVVTVGQNETWRSLATKYGLSLGLLERINHRSRSEALRPGETVIVYTKRPAESLPAVATGQRAAG